MSQRDSGYARKERDLYETPEWVTKALVPHLPFTRDAAVWEPACGLGKMVAALESEGFTVACSDISNGYDFLKCAGTAADAIVTNPPYILATEFIAHALTLMKERGGSVAMLLGNDFDHAKTRQHLLSTHPAYAKKLVLTKRIKWFDEPVKCRKCDGTGQHLFSKCKSCGGKGKKKVGPSENHAWFIWDWQHKGAPTLAYGP